MGTVEQQISQDHSLDLFINTQYIRGLPKTCTEDFAGL